MTRRDLSVVLLVAAFAFALVALLVLVWWHGFWEWQGWFLLSILCSTSVRLVAR
jgi:hypothetical protein